MSVVLSPRLVERLFGEFRASRVPLATFARRAGVAPSRLRAALRKHDPATFADLVHERAARPERRYKRGRAFEYHVRDHLVGRGWWCVRAAGSRGAADLVAARAGVLMILACKNKASASLPTRERAGLLEAVGIAGGHAVLADLEPGRATGIRFRFVTDAGYSSPFEVPPTGEPMP